MPGIIPQFTVTIQDGKGRTAQMVLHSERLDPADFYAAGVEKNYEPMGDNLLQDLEPLIDGEIIGAGWYIPITLDFTPQTADPDCDVEEGATFVFKTAGGYKTRMRIPTFKESFLIAGTELVDTADSTVQDWVNTIIDGPDAVAGIAEDRINMTDSRGDDITELEEAYEKFRNNYKSRR